MEFPGPGEFTRRRWLELLAWCAAALAVSVFADAPSGARPHIYPDSCQYLSAAEQLRTTHRMQTSLVHFDTERSHGVIPAPLTWFPPGYPAAIASVSMLGLGDEQAARWISVASFALVAAGVWWLMRLLDPSVWAARAAALCWLANSQAVFISTAALSESLFTLLGLVSLLFLMRGVTAPENRCGFFWIGSAAAAGLSYWVRYAGILWVLACMTILLADFMLRKTKRGKSAMMAAVALTLLLVAPLMIRNHLLVGDWRGGNNTPFHMPVRELAGNTPKVLLHLVFGNAPVAQVWLAVAVALFGLAGLIFVTLARGARSPALAPPVLADPPIARNRILFATVLIYAAGIAAIAFRSVISYEPRMFIPVLPHLIALSIIGVAFLIRRLAAGGWPHWVGLGIVVCVLLGYGASNFISFAGLPPDDVHQVREALLEPDGTGLSLQQRLDQVLASGEVIAATDGQPLGYVLKHPTLSLVGRPYSVVEWNEQALRKEMSRYGAAHLLVFQDAKFAPVSRESPFLSALANGDSVPWLKQVASNGYLRVYQVQ